MAHINETIAFDRRLVLGNEAYVRRMSFGANWSLLRIGVRFAFNGRSTIPLGLSYIGVCSDPDSTLHHDRVPGACLAVSLRGTYDWTYNARNSDNSYYTSISNGQSAYMKTGSTLSETAFSWGGSTSGVAANTMTPHYWIITIYKTGPRFELRDQIMPTGAQIAVGGKSVHQFHMDMDNENGVNLVNSTRVGLATLFGTTHTPLPYVIVGHPKSTPTMEITHISVVKFA